jgi:hypothetical protein
MRTTIELPEREHVLFTGLARERGVSLGKLLVELAHRGLCEPANRDEYAHGIGKADPDTGLSVFRSGRPVGPDDVRAMLDEVPG